MSKIILPNGRILMAVSEVVSLLAEQSALRFFIRDDDAASANATERGVAGQQDRHGCACDALTERRKHFRLLLEQRAWTRFLQHAAFKSKLLCFRNSAGAPELEFKSMAESFIATADLANWLLGRGFSVKFDPPFMNGSPDTVGSNERAIGELHRKLRKSALIDEFKSRWPTIESDVGKAQSNGLSAARIDGTHGMYDVQLALGWAEEHGRLMAADAGCSAGHAPVPDREGKPGHAWKPA